MELEIDISSPQSISEALRKLEAYTKKVKRAPGQVVKKLVDSGVEQAKEMAEYMSVYDTGELVNSIVGDTHQTTGSVSATAPHAAFCEFGTGVVGSTATHPEAGVQGWKYDVNEHGESGWYYPGKDGRLHFTKGMPSRPYMYETGKLMKDAVPDILKEVLDDDRR